MSEWGDLLDWLPIVASAICGFAAGHFYSRYQAARNYLGATLHILYKLHQQKITFSSSDNMVINNALEFIHLTRWWWR